MSFEFNHEPTGAYPNKEDPNHPANPNYGKWALEHKLWLEAKGDVEAAIAWAKEIDAHIAKAIETHVAEFRAKLIADVDAATADYKARLESHVE